MRISIHSRQIFIVTGSNTGIGKEVAQVLYTKNAKVYLAGRSEQKYLTAMETMKKAAPTSIGELVFLRLDLADLSSVKASAEEFLSKESKLDVLINNAGLQAPPQGSKSAQGYDLQVGVNNLGPFLFTKLLTPILQQTASSQPANTVRVVWLSSAAAELNSHRPGGIDLDNLDYQVEKPPMIQYSISKAGSYLQATEYAKRVKPHGIVSVPINPGNITSELQRHLPTSFKLMTRPMLRPTKYGAYTELFAALSPEVTLEKTGQRGKAPPPY